MTNKEFYYERIDNLKISEEDGHLKVDTNYFIRNSLNNSPYPVTNPNHVGQIAANEILQGRADKVIVHRGPEDCVIISKRGAGVVGAASNKDDLFDIARAAVLELHEKGLLIPS